MASKALYPIQPGDGQSGAPAIPGAGEIACVPWQAMEGDNAAWDALAEAATEANPFYESWYLLPSLRALDPEGDVSILRFEQDGTLCGLLPIIRPHRYYHLPIPNLATWLHANCFLGTPLVAKGSEVPFWQALLAWADAHPGIAMFLHLRDIPLAGPMHAALQGVIAGSERQVELVHRENRAMLDSERDAETYWQESLSNKKRKELRRQRKRLGEEGELSVSRVTDEAGLEDWAEAFLALEAAGWKGTAGSALASDQATAAVFRESLKGAAQRGKLERLSLTLDGRPIAMLASFLAPPGAYSYKTTFDETLARYSPGVLLQRENLAMLDDDSIDWCDSCAASDHPMIDHIWRERRAIGRFSIAIGGTLRRSAFRQLVRLEMSRKNAGAGT